MNNPQCLVLSLDYDGCTDTHSSQQAIIHHISNVYSQFPSIKKIIFLIGSLRQSLYLDVVNAFQNSRYPKYLSCTSLLDEMVPRLKAQLDAEHPEHNIEIIFDTFLQADIYAELDFGTTFDAMKSVFSKHPDMFKQIAQSGHREIVVNQHRKSIELMNARHLVDRSKITIIYGQLHHIATHYPDTSFLMHFYDDRLDILRSIYLFYKSNPKWIPNNFTLNLFCHASLPKNIPSSFGQCLIGESEIIPHYREHLQQLANILHWSSIPESYLGLERYLEEALKQTTPIQTEYSKIQIPELSDTNEEACIINFLSTLEAAANILNTNLELESGNFNDYVQNLEYYDDNIVLFKATYIKESLFQKDTLTKEERNILNNQECILMDYPRCHFEDEYEEALDYAKFRCILDEKIASYHKDYNSFKHKLNFKVSSTLGISVNELLQKADVFKQSNATIVVKPVALKAMPSSIFHTVSTSTIEEESSIETECLLKK